MDSTKGEEAALDASDAAVGGIGPRRRRRRAAVQVGALVAGTSVGRLRQVGEHGLELLVNAIEVAANDARGLRVDKKRAHHEMEGLSKKSRVRRSVRREGQADGRDDVAAQPLVREDVAGDAVESIGALNLQGIESSERPDSRAALVVADGGEDDAHRVLGEAQAGGVDPEVVGVSCRGVTGCEESCASTRDVILA